MRAERNWRVGLIGFGLGGAAFHAPVIAATPGVVIAAIVTSNASRREQAVRMYPAARVFANAAEMFARATDLDIAVVASPNRTHIPLAVDALAAGLHVVVDKPLAASISDAVRAIDVTGDRDRCLRAGMDGYVSKPVDTRLLCAVVEQEEAAPSLAPPGFERAAALERLGGDTQLLSEVIQLFLVDCPLRLAAIKAAVDARDGDAISREAHGLKGAAGNLSAVSLFETAEILEQLGRENRFEAAEAALRQLIDEAAHVLDALRHNAAA